MANSTIASTAPTRRLHYLLIAAAILPMLLAAAIVHRFGVNVPYGDEWSLYSLFEKWHTSQLSFADFFAVHNGHRILFPRLIYLGLIEVTHGNLKAEMYCSLFLCVLTSLCILRLLRQSFPGAPTLHLSLWGLINLFLFSPIQAENWLWGFQLQIFLANLCLVGALTCLTLNSPDFLRLAGAFLLAVAGTFSFGNGLLTWPVIIVVLYYRREKTRIWASWILFSIVVGLVYLRGYPAREPVPATTHWYDYLLFFAGFLGAPLARIPNKQPLVLPVIIGTALVATYLTICVRLLLQRDFTAKAAPWLGLGFYAIVSAIMASFARIHSGAMHSLDSRYTTVSLLLIVSVIVLVALRVAPEMATTPTRTLKATWYGGARLGCRPRAFAAGGIFCLIALYLVNAPHELRYLEISRGLRQRGKGALQFSSVLDVDPICRSALLIRQDPVTFAHSLRVIDQFQLMDPPRRQTLGLSDAEGRPKRATDEYGVFESLRHSPDALAATGWAYLPNEERPASCVILAYRTGTQWNAFSINYASEHRPDLVAKQGNSRYLESGWKQRAKRTSLPEEPQEISAWALDADNGMTYRLPGSFEVP